MHDGKIKYEKRGKEGDDHREFLILLFAFCFWVRFSTLLEINRFNLGKIRSFLKFILRTTYFK